MSPESAKTTVRVWITAWNDTNLAATDDLSAPDYAVNGTLVTPAGVKQAVPWLHSTFGHVVLTAEDMVADEASAASIKERF